jgi:hypothetical protein
MPRPKDAIVLLAEKMVQALRQRKDSGEDKTPLTLEQLARLAEPDASPKTVLAAVHPRRKAFSAHALVARRDMRAPAALLEDLLVLAASPSLLVYALECQRTAANHVASLPELKSKLTSKLHKPFQEAVNRLIAESSVPPGVGWILIKNAKKLLLLSDLHTARERSISSGEPQQDSVSSTKYSALGTEQSEFLAEKREPPHPIAPTRELDFTAAFNDAFAQLDRQAGGHNFVSLVALRGALPCPREQFDAELRQLRLAGQYTLSAAEGRHGLTAAEQEASILENGSLLLYVSRKSP